MSRASVRFSLEVGGRTIDGSAELPAGPVRVLDVLPVLLAIDSAIVQAVAEQAEELGEHISCRAGCGACCCHLVPVSETEALYLAQVVASLPAQRRQEVEERFRAALNACRERGLAVGMSLAGEADDHAGCMAASLDYFQLGIACPFLENESCSIYPHRPMACREYVISSPAENCASHHPAAIRKVELPREPARLMFRFSDGQGRQAPRYVPLVAALEWAGANANAPQPELPGPEIVRNFLGELKGA